MKNTLADLNNHLFAQLERLSDEDIKGDELVQELDRAKAITSVASQVISNGALVLKAIEVKNERFGDNKKMPAMLEG